MPALLELRGLTVKYANRTAVSRITFDVAPGEVVGVIGESGSGKTTLGLAAIRLLPPGGRIAAGSVHFRGRDLADLNETELHLHRGPGVAMIPQEADLTLNPFMRIAEQVEEVIRAHSDYGRERRRAEARKVLDQICMDSNGRLIGSYPHQLSGGERQRAVIACAMACQPELLIADEPLASLDVAMQCEWLAMIKNLRERANLAILLITHNPGILSGIADRIAVMYRGRIVERGPFATIIRQPMHPYTELLLRAVSGASSRATNRERLPPRLAAPMPDNLSEMGCRFAARCPDRTDKCSNAEPPETSHHNQRHVRCFKYGE